jgi:hypothetical protein
MEVITLQTDAYKNLLQEIYDIKAIVVSNQHLTPLTEIWLDISEACLLLKISKRTLQSYRDNQILSFSQIGGKIYFKASDIENLLNSHYVVSKRNR